MSKRQLILQIRQCNTDVPPRFLAQFEPAALKQYLHHLKAAKQGSLRIAHWVRRDQNLRMVS